MPYACVDLLQNVILDSYAPMFSEEIRDVGFNRSALWKRMVGLSILVIVCWLTQKYIQDTLVTWLFSKYVKYNKEFTRRMKHIPSH
jgi:hypothetical protein